MEKHEDEIKSKIAPDDTFSCQGLSFSATYLFTLWINNNNNALSNELIRILNFIRSNPWYELSTQERSEYNTIVELFMFCFTSSSFTIPGNYIEIFLFHQPTITNMVAISDFATTTPWVSKLSTDTGNFFKLLTLLNPRTKIELDIPSLFAISNYFASIWWSFYWLSLPAYCTKETYDAIRKHLLFITSQPFFLFGSPARMSYFPATYVAPDFDHLTKQQLNKLARSAFENVVITNNPTKRSIAILTAKWGHTAVYTSVGPLIKSLSPHYDLTLVHLGPERKDYKETDIFTRRLDIQMINDNMNLKQLAYNNFAACIYPDIGMSTESVFLSNIRLAPVQIALYGHPTSTRGSFIDYFIGGTTVEKVENAEENYSERLVLLPGMGVYPVFPAINRPQYTQQLSAEPCIINCPWTAQKITYPLLETLQKILVKSNRPIVFTFFSGGVAGFNNAMIPFARDLWSVLGKKHVRILPALSRSCYYTEMQKGSFTLDPFPFGGFNTVIDSLYLNKPIITCKGSLAFGRFCAATLELVGLDELIASTHEQYIALAVHLIEDEGYRTELCERTAAIDLAGIFAQTQNPDFLCRAVDFLLANHTTLQQQPVRNPVFIT